MAASERESVSGAQTAVKVGLIIYGSLEMISGGYLYDRKLVEYLRQQGDEVTVISLPWASYGRHLLHNFSRQLLRQLQVADFDVLLQDELNHPSLFLLNRALKQRVTYPIISIVHHLRSSEDHPKWLLWLYRRIEQAYLKSVDGCIFNSRTTRQVVADLVGERPSIIASPGGDRLLAHLSEADIARRAHEPGPLRILFVGNVIPRKGLHTLLTAVAQLPLAVWQLGVVGDTAVDPTYYHKCQQQIRENGLAENVKWYGRLSDEALAAKMTVSQLLAVPSQYEGFGIVYLEGMGFGLPAVGMTGGATAEVIEDGITGYLIAGSDEQLLTSRLQQLHCDRDLLARLSLQARAQFQKRTGWETTTCTVRRFLEEIT